MMEYTDGEGELRGTFEIYKAEGHSLFINGEYKKAIESYKTALEFREGDKDCLVCRSRCHLMLGDNDAAFRDAETSLAEQPDYHKGIYQKAEALYAKGEFEWALMFYHRGHKLRPEMQEFRLGIQKAQEAIDNAVGSPDSVKLTKYGDLSYFEEQVSDKKTKRGKAKQVANKKPTTADSSELKPNCSSLKDKTVKQLLGELYGDRLYLDQLLEDTVYVLKNFNDELNAVIKRQTGTKPIPSSTVHNIVYDSITYLDKRTEFWRQQKPMYARKRDRLRYLDQRKAKFSMNDYIHKELRKIDNEQSEGKFKESLSRATGLQRFIDHHSNDAKETIQNRFAVVAHLHSYTGNAHVESGEFSKAILEYQTDYKIGKEHKLESAKSRALDNLGIAYAKQQDYEKAISTWEKSLTLSKSLLEKVWLFHEIGRSHFEMGNYEQAKEFGLKSFTSAERADDNVWQLRATVLLAQSQVRLKDLQGGLNLFETACDMAKTQSDDTAETVIKQAMSDVKNKILRTIKKQKSAKEKGEEATETDCSPQEKDITKSDSNKKLQLCTEENEGKNGAMDTEGGGKAATNEAITKENNENNTKESGTLNVKFQDANDNNNNMVCDDENGNHNVEEEENERSENKYSGSCNNERLPMIITI